MNAVEELRARREKIVEDYMGKMLALTNQMIDEGVPYSQAVAAIDWLSSDFLMQRHDDDLKLVLDTVEGLIAGRQNWLDRMRTEVLDTMEERQGKKLFELLEERGHGYGEA